MFCSNVCDFGLRSAFVRILIENIKYSLAVFFVLLYYVVCVQLISRDLFLFPVFYLCSFNCLRCCAVGHGGPGAVPDDHVLVLQGSPRHHRSV